MFGLFKKKEDEFKITVIRTSKEVTDAKEREEKFLTQAHTCPECSHHNKPSMIRFEGNGNRYKVPMNCSECSCEWTYERPYGF